MLDTYETAQTLQTAHELRRSGKLNEAAKLYRKLVRKNSNDFHAMHFLGVTEAGGGNFKEAKRLMARSLSIQPPNVLFIENYATILFQAGDYRSALDVCEGGLKLDPASITLLYVSALALFKLDRFDESLAQFDQLILIAPKHVAALNERGSVLAAMERYDDALATIDKALLVDPRCIEAYINKAATFKDMKRYDDALAAYEHALALRPDLTTVWLERGAILAKLGRYEEAIAVYDKALSVNGDLAEAWLGGGNVLYELNHTNESLTAYEKALALNPALAEAWLGRGNVFGKLRRLEESLAAFDRALELNLSLAEARLGRGNILQEVGRHDDALAAYGEALDLNPNLANAWLGLGNALYVVQRYHDANAAYDKALELNPDLAKAWLGRGNIFSSLGVYAESLAAHDKALALQPGLAEAWLGRGNALSEMKHHDEALVAYDRALALNPELVSAWLGRGNVFGDFGRHDDSLGAYDRALALKPDFVKAWLGRGMVFSRNALHDDAMAAFNRMLELKPDSAEARLGRARSLFETNQLSEALAEVDEALAIKPNLYPAISYRIFALDFASDVTVAEQQKARSHWWQAVGAKIFEHTQSEHLNSRDPDRRLKIGYVSADFRTHSAAFCFKPVLLNHDKTRFEITCYSSSLQVDSYTEDFRRATDRWRNVTQLTGDEFSAQIRTDEIDILVDLSGHTAGNRLGVFARKLAPIQVTAWGNATGTGMPTMDYLFSDPVTCPPEVRHLFAEKIFDLPCAITIEQLLGETPPSDPPVLSNGHITFGAFNRSTKITGEVVALWARILHAVPQSRLLLKHYGFDQPAVRTTTLEKFTSHGVAADRIAFLGATSRADHLAAFKNVDIALDPFPQNGGISTFETLQMGVPTVTMLGKTIPSRIAGAILTAVGLGGWVAEDADGYLAIATKFAAMPEHLGALRRELPVRLSSCPATNNVLYTKAVETAYRTMWQDYCRSATAQASAA